MIRFQFAVGLHRRWLCTALILAVLVGFSWTLPPTATAASQLTATWQDTTNDQDGFTLQRKTGTTGAYSTIATLGPTVLSYVDTTVTVGATYCYQVAAFNAAGTSPFSNEACATVPAPVTYGLTVTPTGSGTVASSPSGIACAPTCSASFNGGTSVALSATPASGFSFTGWSGACAGTGTCTVILDAAKTVGATFTATPVTYALTVTKSGTGSGTVTSAPTGIACGSTCTASYASGTSVTLTATPATGSTFTGWSGACTGTGTCSVTLSAARSVTATFTAQPTTYTLTVTKSGTGTGTVTSTPSGISCGSTCSASFSSGTSVTLTATSATGSTFTGWGGACSGTGTCSVTMNQAQTVTATFALLPSASTLVAPTGAITSAVPTFTWNAVSAATYYYLWVNDGSGTPKIRSWYSATQAGCATGSGTCSVTPWNAMKPGTYTWWVETWSPAGYGPWSSPLSFAAGNSSNAATLIAPTGVITSAVPTFTWNAVSTATYYFLWVNDGTGTPRIRSWYTASQAGCATGSGTCSVAPGTTITSGTYTWWIQAWGPAGYGPWSIPLSFTAP